MNGFIDLLPLHPVHNRFEVRQAERHNRVFLAEILLTLATFAILVWVYVSQPERTDGIILLTVAFFIALVGIEMYRTAIRTRAIPEARRLDFDAHPETVYLVDPRG